VKKVMMILSVIQRRQTNGRTQERLANTLASTSEYTNDDDDVNGMLKVFLNDLKVELLSPLMNKETFRAD
jgi:hypothetical protein